MGAGVGGLSCAHELSKNPNYEIHVYERHDKIGGLARSDLTDDNKKSQIKSAILEKINSEQLFATQKDLLIQHLDRTLNSYKTAFIKKNIKKYYTL